MRAQHRLHRDFEPAIGNSSRFRFLLAQSDAREFWIGEKAKRNLPARGYVVAASQVVANDAEIVDADVCELRAARHFSDGPDAGRGGLQAVVDLDISAIGEFDAGQFQAESFGVRIAACGNSYMTTLHPRESPDQILPAATS